MSRQVRKRPSDPLNRRRPWWCGLFCAGAAVLCYANTLGNDFCDDDLAIIVQNPLVTQPGQWGKTWLTDYWHARAKANPYRDLLYRPLTILSFRLNHAVGGLNTVGYHLVNIALHALVTVLLYRLARRLLDSDGAALAAGLLFAVLPIHTEAVNCVVGRAELLAAGFILVSIELFSRSQRWPMLLAGSVSALAACCSKESGAAVFLLVPLVGWFEGGRPVQGRRRAAQAPQASLAGRLLLPFAALLPAAVVYLALRYVTLDGALYQPVTITRTVNVLADASVWGRVCGAFQLLGMYWAKTVWPQVLCLDYSINAVVLTSSLFSRHALLGIVVFSLLIGWSAVQWLRGDRLPAVLTAALLISYLPVSNTVVLIKMFFAERVWYVPSIWAVLVVVLLLAGRDPRPAPAKQPRHGGAGMRTLAATVVAAVVVAGLPMAAIRPRVSGSIKSSGSSWMIWSRLS